MSYDQKPARIKLVGSGAPARTPGSTPGNTLAERPAVEPALEDAGTAANVSRGFALMPAILFLAGCAIGGAGLAAWPHLAG